MIQSGFFNSVNGDRKYNADFFAKFFGTLIGNGVFPNPSTGLQVYESSNMTITVKPGRGWINGYFIVNDGDFNLPLANADGVLNRIDRIVMRYENANRQINILVKQGTFASTPVAPTLQRDADYYELALADIYVGKGVTAITQSNITDQRLNTSVCGIVKGLIDQVDTTTIFNQYQAWFAQITGNTQSEIDAWQAQQEQAFNDWFATVQDTLSGDVAGNLANQITIVQQDLATHKTDYVQHPGTGTTTNTGNAYAVTLNPAPTSYVDKMGLILTINADSTGASTINVNSLGTKPIKKANGNDVTNLKLGGIYSLRYNASTGNFILQGEGGEYGTATTSDVLSGKTFGTENGLVTGTLTLASLGGKKWASGTVTSSSSTETFTFGSGTTGPYPSVTVSGLSFKPSVIILKYFDGTNVFETIYDSDSNKDFIANNVKFSKYKNDGISTSNYYFKGDVLPAYVNETGFKLPVEAGYSKVYGWKAYE